MQNSPFFVGTSGERSGWKTKKTVPTDNNNYNNTNNNNNGNFICVFECTIVNLATYRQFTNAASDWIIKKKKQ